MGRASVAVDQRVVRVSRDALTFFSTSSDSVVDGA